MVFVEVAVTNCDCAFPTVLLVLMGKGSLTGRLIFEKKLILIYKLHYIFTNYILIYNQGYVECVQSVCNVKSEAHACICM